MTCSTYTTLELPVYYFYFTLRTTNCRPLQEATIITTKSACTLFASISRKLHCPAIPVTLPLEIMATGFILRLPLSITWSCKNSFLLLCCPFTQNALGTRLVPNYNITRQSKLNKLEYWIIISTREFELKLNFF